MLLTDEQKAVFARWLQLQILNSQGIEREFEAVLSGPALNALKRKESIERAGCEIVLRMITSGETMTVGGQ